MVQDNDQSTTQFRGECPEELWQNWMRTVPRRYSRAANKIPELLELDLRCKREGVELEQIVDEYFAEQE